MVHRSRERLAWAGGMHGRLPLFSDVLDYRFLRTRTVFVPLTVRKQFKTKPSWLPCYNDTHISI